MVSSSMGVAFVMTSISLGFIVGGLMLATRDERAEAVLHASMSALCGLWLAAGVGATGLLFLGLPVFAAGLSVATSVARDPMGRRPSGRVDAARVRALELELAHESEQLFVDDAGLERACERAVARHKARHEREGSLDG
jgi:hypothetical protein